MTDPRLELTVVRDARGLTRLAELRQAFPLRTTGLMYLEAAAPGMAYAYLQNPSGALFGGDRHGYAVTVGSGCRLHLTTQSATRIARRAAGTGGGTVQAMTVRLDGDGYLEHLPDALVPMAGADFRQETTLSLAEGAAYLGLELLSPGRLGHGERFAYERAHLVTTVERDDGASCRDALRLQPTSAPPDSAGRLGEREHHATVLALAPATKADSLLDPLLAVTTRSADVLGGVTALPDGLGVLVRLIAADIRGLRAVVADLVDAARHVLAGLPPAVLRK